MSPLGGTTTVSLRRPTLSCTKSRWSGPAAVGVGLLSPPRRAHRTGDDAVSSRCLGAPPAPHSLHGPFRRPQATQTLTTVGYGTVACTETAERWYVIVGMIIGALIYSYVIGTVCTVIHELMAVSLEFQENMDLLTEYMLENDLPHTFRRKASGQRATCLLARKDPGSHGSLCRWRSRRPRQRVRVVGLIVVALLTPQLGFHSAVAPPLWPLFWPAGRTLQQRGAVAPSLVWLSML